MKTPLGAIHMKKKITFTVILMFAFLSGCSLLPSKPQLVYEVQIQQPKIDSQLLEPSIEAIDTMTAEEFQKLSLSDRFIYFGNKIISLKSALNSANEKIKQIKNIYETQQDIIDKNDVKEK